VFTRDAVSRGKGGSPQIATVLSWFPGHQSYFRIADDADVNDETRVFHWRSFFEKLLIR
jgi:hypothetical protein